MQAGALQLPRAPRSRKTSRTPLACTFEYVHIFLYVRHRKHITSKHGIAPQHGTALHGAALLRGAGCAVFVILCTWYIPGGMYELESTAPRHNPHPTAAALRCAALRCAEPGWAEVGILCGKMNMKKDRESKEKTRRLTLYYVYMNGRGHPMGSTGHGSPWPTHRQPTDKPRAVNG